MWVHISGLLGLSWQQTRTGFQDVRYVPPDANCFEEGCPQTSNSNDDSAQIAVLVAVVCWPGQQKGFRNRK